MKSTGSWGMMDNFERKSSRPISKILISSIFITPEVKSTNLNSATPSEDFPDPVLPTIPEKSNANVTGEKWKCSDEAGYQSFLVVQYQRICLSRQAANWADNASQRLRIWWHLLRANSLVVDDLSQLLHLRFPKSMKNSVNCENIYCKTEDAKKSIYSEEGMHALDSSEAWFSFATHADHVLHHSRQLADVSQS